MTTAHMRQLDTSTPYSVVSAEMMEAGMVRVSYQYQAYTAVNFIAASVRRC